MKCTGCSAVRLAHLLWEQGVPGSNPGTPTKKDSFEYQSCLFLYVRAKEGMWIYWDYVTTVLEVLPYTNN